MFPAYGVPLSGESLTTQSRDLFDLDFRYVRLDPDTGVMLLPSGHSLTLTRNSTTPTVYDANGTTYTAMTQEPAWEQRDWDGDGVRESFGVLTSTTDRYAAPSNLRPQAMTGLLEMIETGRIATADSCYFAHTNDAGTGAGFYISTSGTYYQMKYYDGSTTRTALLASGAAVDGDRVRFTWELTSAGALTFRASINGGADIVATAAALALPASWASSSSWRLNSQGTSLNWSRAWYRRVRVCAGYVPLEQLVERR